MSFFEDIQNAIDNLGYVHPEVNSPDHEELTAPVAGKDEYEWYQSQIYLPTDKRQRLCEYEEMNSYPEISSGLDIYADDATQDNEDGHKIQVISENEKLKEELENLFYDNVAVDSMAWGIFRTTCMYGDSFYELILSQDKKSVLGIKWLPPKTMYRVEENGKLRGFIQEIPQGEATKFMPFEIIHFKLTSTTSNFNPYGTSILESSRRTWRQLKLMEDAMVVYRVSRAPERRVFRIYTGALPPAAAEQHIERQRKKYRKRAFINQRTGQFDWRANSIAPDEDYYVPVGANGQGTQIDTLPGATNLGEIDDVRYFKDKIFAALKIPRLWLQDTEGRLEPRQNLSHQDIRFSRTIERVQSQVLEGFKKIAIVHLLLRGYKKEEINEFEIKLTPPSNINEKIALEVSEQKLRLVRDMVDFGFSRKYLAQKFFNVNEEEWVEQLPLAKKEKKFWEAAGGFGSDEEEVPNPYTLEKPKEPEGEGEGELQPFGDKADMDVEGLESEQLSVFESKKNYGTQGLYRRFIFEGELDGVDPSKRRQIAKTNNKYLVEKIEEISQKSQDKTTD